MLHRGRVASAGGLARIGLAMLLAGMIPLVVWACGTATPPTATHAAPPSSRSVPPTVALFPDLRVVKVHLDPPPIVTGEGGLLAQQTEYSIRVEIENVGEATIADNVFVSFSVEDCFSETTALAIMPGSGSAPVGVGMRPHERRLSGTMKLTLRLSGYCTVMYRVDPNDFIAESDEGNNFFLETYEVR